MSSQTLDLIKKAQEGNKAACETLIQENSGLIWSIVRRFFGRGIESDDLYQLGCVGFIKAVKGFDLHYGTQFSTYAVPKISGEIRRFLRDDGIIKISRSTKELAYKVMKIKEQLELTLARQPKLSEIAEKLGVTAEEVAMCETATQTTDSLQRSIGQDGFTLEKCLGNDGIEEKIVESITLKNAISSLPDKEKQVILLRFYKGLTQQKTAKVLDISQVQVSRIERRAIGILKQKIG